MTITFDANGGSGSVPENIIANVDDYVNLPNKPENLTRENYKFIGWCTGTDASGVYDGENGTIQGKYPVYPEGSQIIMPENGCTLYAAWVQINGYANGTIVAAIIHAGSTIPAEPGCFNKTDTFDYTMVNGFNKVNVNVLDYFNPAVTVVGVDSVDKALTQKAKQELEEAVKKQSNLSYNPDTQYLAWHVIKDQQNDHKWHIDGTIQNKNTVKLEYDPNGAITGAIPGGVTAYKGDKVTVSDNVNGLARPGFNFIGWNTNADGSGTAYAVNSEITLNENVTLYAQWQAKNAVTIKYEATNGGAVSNGQDLLNPDTGTPQGSTPSAKPGYHFVNWTIKGTDTVITAGVDKETNQLVPTREEGAVWTAVTYVANFAPDTNTQYTVEYYLQENGVYSETASSSVTREGTTDTNAQVTEQDKTAPAGYAYDTTATNVESANINGDGSTVLKVYFKQQFTVTYKPGEHAAADSQEQSTSALDYNAGTPQAPTYTGAAGYHFTGWSPEVATNVTANAEYVAQWAPDTNTQYTVEYYLQENGVYSETASSSVTREGTTDTNTQVTEQDKTAPAGYAYDTTATNVESANINGDGSTVLKVYFKQQFTVTYKPGEHAAADSQEQSTSALDYNAGTPQAPTYTGAAGYHFTGWSPEVATNVTANAEYVAQWAPDTNTRYTVEYYLQNLDDNGYTKDENVTVTSTGTTDTQATAEEKSFDGFTLNKAVEGTVAADTIKGDGSTVLKLYYDRNSYKVTYQYAEGTPDAASALPTEATVKFGAEVTVAPEATLAGYTFNEWAAPEGVTVTDGKFTMGSSDVVLTGSFIIRQDLTYTVNYIEYGTNNILAPQAVVQNQTFDTTVNVNAIVIDGYALVGEPTQQLIISADETQNVINFYYGVDNVSTDPANPGSSDGVPDMYQARVNFAAVNGSVSFPVTYVTLYDADGNYAVDGTGHLTANQIAAATANAGYDQASLTWNVTPSTTTPITSEVTYTATFTATPVVPVAPTPTPVPAGPGVPAVAPGVPTPAAAAAAAPLAAPVATITDDATPLAAGETIDDEDTPLAAFDHVDCWVHWFILVGIILTAIYGAVVVRRRLAVVKDVDDLEDEVLDGAVAGATQSAPADNRQAI